MERREGRDGYVVSYETSGRTGNFAHTLDNHKKRTERGDIKGRDWMQPDISRFATRFPGLTTQDSLTVGMQGRVGLRSISLV
ncbi:hypothetical protein GN244_ATG07144 [Phytophthora infestans]|uniref:Uncharacterized protein n=1 Tax=Phytophthora infestans TaxID=4787 RepID=A0A833SWT6_PHYIN|nr:hypothetical protein GN244_ATG20420 [Phytophthora infestans]KAF4040633.1 hypothetical protein GN244_ATG07144 [Phytophthora infestans]KAF4145223.1 hypothetical protein GN958_ATG05577 [Phytophthora infestans]